MCCLNEVCHAGLVKFKITFADRKQRCPGLQFDGDKSSCAIVLQCPDLSEPMGMGQGCCIKARVASPAGVVAFENLDGDLKIVIAQKVRHNQAQVIHSK
jgi:hypothetical protein